MRRAKSPALPGKGNGKSGPVPGGTAGVAAGVAAGSRPRPTNRGKRPYFPRTPRGAHPCRAACMPPLRMRGSCTRTKNVTTGQTPTGRIHAAPTMRQKRQKDRKRMAPQGWRRGQDPALQNETNDRPGLFFSRRSTTMFHFYCFIFHFLTVSAPSIRPCSRRGGRCTRRPGSPPGRRRPGPTPGLRLRWQTRPRRTKRPSAGRGRRS